MSAAPVRLNRFLASCGHGSRRACDDLIRSGRVTVNGGIVVDLSTRVSSGDQVAVDGRNCRPPGRVVLMLHKPKGVICSKTDLEDRPTVFQLLPPGLPQLFYVGRLDVDSEGLLLMTNDGDLAERISHPRNKLPKVYEVTLDRPFEAPRKAALLRGVETEFGFGRMESVEPLGGTRVRVVLTQGLKRQVRLMFRKVGYKVTRLCRTQIGGLRLERLKPGQHRMLEDRDLRLLDAVDLQAAVAERPTPPSAPSPRRAPARRASLKSRHTDLDREVRRRQMRAPQRGKRPQRS